MNEIAIRKARQVGGVSDFFDQASLPKPNANVPLVNPGNFHWRGFPESRGMLTAFPATTLRLMENLRYRRHERRCSSLGRPHRLYQPIERSAVGSMTSLLYSQVAPVNGKLKTSTPWQQRRFSAKPRLRILAPGLGTPIGSASLGPHLCESRGLPST